MTPKMLLDQFENEIIKTSAMKLDEYIYFFDFKKDKTLGVTALTHGNETIGIHAALTLLEKLQKGFSPDCNLLLSLNNVEAFLQGERYLDVDMNRSFGIQTAATLPEEKRAAVVQKAIQRCDYVLDIHQTIEPTESPFFIFKYSPKNFQWAKAINPTLPIVTSNQNLASNVKGTTFGAYCLAQNIPAIVLESGEKGFSGPQLELVMKCLDEAMKLKVQEVLPSLESEIYLFDHFLPNKESVTLLPGLKNFTPVGKQDVLTEGKEELKAGADGVVLFPKYGKYAEGVTELVRIMTPTQLKNL